MNVTLNDSNGPVPGATVTISEGSTSSGNILFQQVTNSSGTVTGSINVPTVTTAVTTEINLGNSTVSSVIPTVINNSNGTQSDLLVIDREIVVSGTVQVSQNVTDTDGDGTPDSLDDYPTDSTRSAMIRYPSSGFMTVAFEDLYPTPGDADLNDYVVHFYVEEDLNASGKIVRVRGKYQHVARGAGYRHELRLRLPVSTTAQVTRSSVNASGTPFSSSSVQTYLKNGNGSNGTTSVSFPASVNSTLSSADLSGLGVLILPESSQTISSPNSSAGQTYQPGVVSNLEVIFTNPVQRSAIGVAPFDVYAYVLDTKQEIHRPGLYLNGSSDLYRDPSGFPFVVMVPGFWKWPLETLDIRNSGSTGYSQFISWMNSNGNLYRDWYKTVTDSSKVFDLPNISSLTGFLVESISKNLFTLGMVLVLISGIYFVWSGKLRKTTT